MLFNTKGYSILKAFSELEAYYKMFDSDAFYFWFEILLVWSSCWLKKVKESFAFTLGITFKIIQ